MTAVKERPSVRQEGADIVLSSARLVLADTLDCGQAFRWENRLGRWCGVAMGRALCVYERPNGDIVFADTSPEIFDSVWRPYFDLDRDYEAVIEAVSQDPVLKRAAGFAGGIRILRQDPWEALCSFIISQNNNIPRIKGIISRLCEGFGEPLGGGNFAFPSAQTVAALTVDDLAPLRSGFRAKYILDAACRVASGEIELDALSSAPLDSARAELMRIKGVGPKVADCALLFGCGRIECFPVDVWIGRAMKTLFDGSLPECAAPFAGIAQQYIFHYARMTKLQIEDL